MELVVETPAFVRLTNFSDPLDQIATSLSYKDKAANFEYQRARKSSWLVQKLGEEGYAKHLAQLKSEIKKTCLLKDSSGYYTYSGLVDFLASKTGLTPTSYVKYPDPKPLAWAQVPKETPHPYQRESYEKLLAIKHGGVEIGTGLGKSIIIELLVRNLGLKTVVMTPSTSISEQLLKRLTKSLGGKNVGQYFDGKKQASKQVVVANAQSLTRVEPGTPDWIELSQAKVFISDESHQCPAATLSKVCFGLMERAPYRYFFSATQMRNDGLDLLLQGITGPIVYKMTVKEGVDQGFLAKPYFRIVNTESLDKNLTGDPIALTRRHLYANPKIAEYIGKTANASVEAGRPVVILIEEIEQFARILPYLRHPVGFAHGPLTKDNKKSVPVEYQKSEPNDLVEKFNAKEIPILVGTSCITTGTDIQAVQTMFYWQGGQSEIQVKQAMGRSTRLYPNKKHCVVFDFNVTNIDTLVRHTEARMRMYEELFPDIKEVSI